MQKDELERLLRVRNRKALVCQRAYRGHVGRERARERGHEVRRVAKAVTHVQRHFRGSRVLAWRDVRLNKAAAFVYEREAIEFAARAADVAAHDALRKEGAGKDSASEEDEEDVDDLWVPQWDAPSGRPCWCDGARCVPITCAYDGGGARPHQRMPRREPRHALSRGMR